MFQKRNKLHSEEECRFIGHCCIGVYFDTNGDHADNHQTFTDGENGFNAYINIVLITQLYHYFWNSMRRNVLAFEKMANGVT